MNIYIYTMRVCGSGHTWMCRCEDGEIGHREENKNDFFFYLCLMNEKIYR